MSEDTPEKVEDQPEEATAKKKTARKRSKASEPSADSEAEGSAAEPKAVDSPSEEKAAAADAAGSANESSDSGGRKPMEDGETPTENPSIRRISSKRKNSPDSGDGDESPDQIPTIVEPPSADAQGKKRRRRRRKGPGDHEDTGGGDEARQASRSSSRIQVDPDKVEKKAWKIFLSEVSEEGLALVSDQDAKEIGRRSFRLAEIFLEEASKRQ